jgi:hypothetical protein
MKSKHLAEIMYSLVFKFFYSNFKLYIHRGKTLSFGFIGSLCMK